ncbi:MAG: immunoglobulin domain-containing protein, partial [Verrucomicrobia bacterium]|nr:immunoglobulin domain-containing protein [Verrucomicrobiota bacterium]
NNPYYTAIDGILFDKSETRILRYPPAKEGIEYIVPENVTTLDDYTFENCKHLENVIIPDICTFIPRGLFEHSGICSITVPEGVTLVREYAFNGCINLTEFKFKGDAPEVLYDALPSNSGAILYYKEGKTGWTNPWYGIDTVMIENPQIINNPEDCTVIENATVTFTVTATGTDLTYQWYKDGNAIEGATGTSYTINSVQLSDNGVYTVSAKDFLNTVTVSNEAELTVVEKPVIVGNPVSAVVNEGGSVTFEAEVSGIGLSYQWFKNDEPISGATGSSYTINPVKPENAGSYAVEVTNIAGTVSSELAELTVIEKVRITTQPVSQTVDEDGTVTFAVTVTGTAPISYQWYKNGEFIDEATESSYTIISVGENDAGDYTVTVSNSANRETSDAAVLTVLIYRTHPADTNKDFVIDDMELMDYATRWLFGDPDIPDEYLMWGANIWLTGGAYGYQSDLEEPYCWVSQ